MKKLILIATLVLVSGCSSPEEATSMYQGTSIVLGVGQNYGIYADGVHSLLFAGMVNDTTFSTSSSEGHFSINLYFSVTSKTITVDDVIYDVISVSPDELHVKINKVM